MRTDERMTPLTPERLDEIQERLDAAKEDPPPEEWSYGAGIAWVPLCEHAPQDLADLMDEVERLGAVADDLREQLGLAIRERDKWNANAAEALSEVERLEARLTVDDDMIRRANEAAGQGLGYWESSDLEGVYGEGKFLTADALRAALGTQEGP